MEIKNNIRDKVFVCPKCGNKALVPIEMNENTIGIDYHDLCICEECDSKLYTKPQFDCTVKFVELGNASM